MVGVHEQGGTTAMKNHRIIRTQGQRIAWTNTSRIPDEQIVAAIKFVAREVDLDRVIIHYKRDNGGRANYGLAYPYIPTIANLSGLKRSEWRWLITVTDQGSSSVHKRVVNTLAHEGKHIEQFRRGTFRRERRARNCEAQARAFGGWVANRWATS
jgi:hypothetical protein